MRHAMQIRVETYVEEDGVEKLRRFRFDSREIEVAENVDQWHGADYRYFTVRASDGTAYILRLNDLQADWELTMCQRAAVHCSLRDR
jgi:hypothetical protein